jgi:hypothetical protein
MMSRSPELLLFFARLRRPGMSMADARESDLEPANVAPAEPSEWVKPVELIELLQRRSANRKQVKAPTSSPFYDAEFGAQHRRRNDSKPD